jgi:hypothetical protein
MTHLERNTIEDSQNDFLTVLPRHKQTQVEEQQVTDTLKERAGNRLNIPSRDAPKP